MTGEAGDILKKRADSLNCSFPKEKDNDFCPVIKKRYLIDLICFPKKDNDRCGSWLSPKKVGVCDLLILFVFQKIIVPEIEVALRYTLLTLLTLFILFKLLYTA